VNDVICEYTGYTRDELLTMNLFNLFTEESQKLMLARLEKLMAGEKTETTVEYCIRTKNGNELWALINARYIYEAGQLKGATGIIYNITDRRKVAEALRESEIKYRALIETTQTGFVIIDQDGLVLDANPEYVRLTGHHDLSEIVGRSVIEGTADHEKEKNAAAVGECFKKGYIRNLEIAYVDSKGSFTPIEINATYMESEGVAQILTLCRDITQRKRAEEKLLQTLESIRRAVGTTVQVMVSAVEIRDPYTSGHQLRSADLARAIATEMGLPQEKIDGIRMAGSIHDIGKLSIPAEILSKPTKLTNLEFSLIKEHSRSGYEMLKDVESPWPLAQIVYQHHEGWMVQAIQEI
jgi:PAS domain S-box-containing protein